MDPVFSVEPVDAVAPVEPVTELIPDTPQPPPAPPEAPPAELATVPLPPTERSAQETALRQASEPLSFLDVEARDGNLQAQRLVAKYAAEQVAEDADATREADAAKADAADPSQRPDPAPADDDAALKAGAATAEEAAATQREVDERAIASAKDHFDVTV